MILLKTINQSRVKIIILHQKDTDVLLKRITSKEATAANLAADIVLMDLITKQD